MHIIRGSSTSAGRPEGMNERFDRVVEAARLKTVPDSEKMDYFKSMISDKERLEYGDDRYAEGKIEGAALEKQRITDILKSAGVSEDIISQL